MNNHMTIFILIFIFLIGLVIGSFTNCFIWRLHKDESLWGRSYCPKCRKNIAWYDNLPIISYFFLNRKCRHCKKKISIQYPAVELATGLLFLVSFWLSLGKLIPEPLTCYNTYLLLRPEFVLTVIRDFFIIFVMVSIFIYDLRWMLIPDKLILPASGLVFIINLLLGFPVMELLFLAAMGTSFFLIQFVVSRGKWIGGGDLRLGLFMGLAFGSLGLLITGIILAYCIGSIVGIFLILAKKKSWKSKVPLGVFLAISTILTLFFGNNLVSWYLELL